MDLGRWCWVSAGASIVTNVLLWERVWIVGRSVGGEHENSLYLPLCCQPTAALKAGLYTTL